MDHLPSRDCGNDERTGLLQKKTSQIISNSCRGNDSTYENTEERRNTDINQPESMLHRTERMQIRNSIGSESQSFAMFTDSPIYGTIKSGSRKLSISTSLKRIETCQSDHLKLNSPFLTGISVQRFWLIFAVVLISFFIACFDTTVMVSSHPVITSYFGSSNKASWLSTAFLLTSTGFQPLLGGLSDTIGRKKPIIFSLSILTLATLWCGLAQSMTSFIIARAFCGLGAGGMMILSSIIVSDLVPLEIRGIYQSYINVVFGVGSASGAALGGWIADTLGWRWEFGIQIPVLLICFCVACIAIPHHLGLAEGVKEKSLLEAVKVFDYKGSILLITSTTFLILGLNIGGNILAWTHPIVIVSLIISITFFPLLIYVEYHATNPIMPPKIMFQSPRAGLILISCFGALVSNAVIFNVPLFFQAVMLESATNSGLRLLLPSIVASTAGTLVGFLITWTKRLKIYLMIGLSFSLLGSVALSLLQRDWPEWVYLLFLVPNSLGQGLVVPTLTMTILSVSPQSEQAVVTSTLILWRSLGTVFGVSFSSLILQNLLRFFLVRNLVGPDRLEVIEAVRKRVSAIYDLEPYYQEQVRSIYALALRYTFGCSGIFALTCVVVLISLKLPRLGATQRP